MLDENNMEYIYVTAILPTHQDYHISDSFICLIQSCQEGCSQNAIS